MASAPNGVAVFRRGLSEFSAIRKPGEIRPAPIHFILAAPVAASLTSIAGVPLYSVKVDIFPGIESDAHGRVDLAFEPVVNYAAVQAIQLVDEGRSPLL